MHVGRLHLEICTVRRADPPLPEAHGTKAVPLPPVPAFVLTIRPSVTAHEATLRYTWLPGSHSRVESIEHTMKEDIIAHIIQFLLYFFLFFRFSSSGGDQSQLVLSLFSPIQMKNGGPFGIPVCLFFNIKNFFSPLSSGCNVS